MIAAARRKSEVRTEPPLAEAAEPALRGYKRVLALGAHPDDVELGCGGTLVLASRVRVEVNAVVLSDCEDEAPKDAKQLRADEFIRACEVTSARPHVFSIPNREFPEHRMQVMEILEELQAELRPDLVFFPFLDDPHQDHSTLGNAAVRTFRSNETLLQYEILRYGSHSFTPSLFIDITTALNQKLDALQCYESQFAHRAYFDIESFRSLARTRGAQSGVPYAEGFVLYKMFW
ncbi:hypothetical protein AUI46_08150 [archaeon 13_1_40CM_2_52_13]|nr:MAG: hypothetical protein AUI46_08150 [archaeon 13_1_40CM_2_52_13]